MNTTQKTIDKNRGMLKDKLRELFQLDRGDLDFGLYRIMAHKREEVDDFLESRLLPAVTEALGDIAGADLALLHEKRNDALQRAQGVIDNPEESNEIKAIDAEIAAAKIDGQIEANAYNHLYHFFARYYDEGDFMSLRRYKNRGNEAYAIPYNGEEVKLHWANADQYYIKTTENYSSYIFRVDHANHQARVRFEIADADNEKDHIQDAGGKKRLFVLAKHFVETVGDDLIIRFEHRPLTAGEKPTFAQGANQQNSIVADAEQRICKKLQAQHTAWLAPLCRLCPTKANEQRTLLGKHLAAYTAKNSFDYFIHKDLGGFLRRELDVYLKNEVVLIDGLQTAEQRIAFARNLAQAQAIKTVAEKIIDFLAQLENFQKQLWLKKKFVLDAQYCVTLDKVPSTFYKAIAKNKAQCNEWANLFALAPPPLENQVVKGHA